MRKAHMVGGGVKKDKLTENEYLIYTLAVLPVYAGSSAGTGLLPRLWHIEKYI